MKLGKRWRLVKELRFVLGAAAAGCLLGAVAALVLPPYSHVGPPLGGWVQTFVKMAHGVGLGWWAGLFWGILVVFSARGAAPLPLERMANLGLWVAAAGLATLILVHRHGLSPSWSLLLASLLALVATRLGIAFLRRDHW